jgi:SAM-dependent methyltransferase
VYGVAKVTGNSRLQSDVLEELTDARRYRHWLAGLARPYLGSEPIEIGSGTGDYALEWLPDVASFTATEADEDRYKALTQRFADHVTIRVRYLLLGDDSSATAEEAARHTGAVALNVLEHIPDHVSALRAMADLVRPGGAVVLVAPAFPSAMSRFDLAIGHQRRYTLARMRATLLEADLRIEELRYLNPLGLISWYVMVKALRMAPHNGPALRIYDRTMVPLARLADRLRAPFGQSVFAVARRRDDSAEHG